jgi:hypothetical protein
MKRRHFLQSAVAAVAATTLRPAEARALARPWLVPVRPGDGTQDVEAVTGDGRRVTLRGADLEDLVKRLRGRLLLAGNSGYDEARHILNPSFDKRPALIAQVTGAADVATAVDFARDHGGLLLAVKCGGHSLSGKSTCDMGMMIDLAPFRAVRVDPWRGGRRSPAAACSAAWTTKPPHTSWSRRSAPSRTRASAASSPAAGSAG